ncbi:MAG: hypothetical protein Q4F27_03245 [Desulfovibrionaceae bacterium]|nr:hypothetical protein [Desulfovibrionaceae bacterium]
MPQLQEDFQNAVWQILEAVMFENWLRFYFISEKPDAPEGPDGEQPLFLAVPDKAMERIGELYPHLQPLAQSMNGQELSFELSQQSVCSFVAEHLDGKSFPRDTAGSIFNSTTFQVQMQMFNAWIQMHEDQLDQGFVEFGAWRKLFAQWRESPGASELAGKLAMSVSGTGASGNTVQ